jgi:penicillin V acylase-like amidase (Ntn superfamily)
VVPRGYAFTGVTPAGDGLKYIAKHAAVGAIAFTDVKLMDGTTMPVSLRVHSTFPPRRDTLR